ncbi:MAG TPA: hydrogenase maturation nickel metallochaperone HypA [Clostridiales bacterium]|nr:hydrogenase maturation nickel metallochaperone HypA [Clostridiales bacterium]
MHEYPITQQIIKIAENHAKEAGAAKVTAIHLVVGEYSGFIGESIQMYFDVISEDTLCHGAKIDIQRVKPKLQCNQCGAYFERRAFSFQCPECGGEGGPTEIGKEFYIDSIEVET